MNSNILVSWKEISAYTGFTERTLQRWEQRFGFPVHRPAGKARSAVSALITEIEAWLSAAPSIPEIRQTFARYPGKLSQRRYLLSEGGLACSAADSPPLLSPSAGKPRLALHAKFAPRTSLELTEILVSEVRLMKLLREEQARQLAEMVTLRAKLANTRETSARALRNLRPLQPTFSWSRT
jgi:predicted DNA-binding transcriptional regulator AlpA